jgi:hypothetical protein
MKRIASLAIMGTLALSMLGGAAFGADWDDYHGNRYADRDDYRGRANYGFDRGLHDGSHSGHEDAEHGYRFRATDHGQFKGGLDGYNGGCSKDEYRDAYRAGYMRGYRQAFNETVRSMGYWR